MLRPVAGPLLVAALGAGAACSLGLDESQIAASAGSASAASSGAGAAGAGGAASSSAASGGGGCAPQCDGKTCGDDLCGSTCGTCTADQQCDATGSCVACSDTWKLEPPGLVEGDRLLADGTGALLACGSTDPAAPRPWVAYVDTCTGALIDDTTFGDATTQGTNVLSRAKGTVFSAGRKPGAEPFVQALAEGSLAPAWTHVMPGAALDADEVWDVVAAKGGGAFAAMILATKTAPQAAIAGVSAGGATSCIHAQPESSSHAIAYDNGDVYLATVVGSNLRVKRFDEATCTAAPPCSCPAQAVSPDVNLGAYTDPRQVLVVGPDVFVSGFATTASGVFFGFIVSFDRTTVAKKNQFTYHPTLQYDALVGLASDGLTLYASGIKGWAGPSEDFTSGTGVVLALPLSLIGQPIWEKTAAGADVLWFVAADPGIEGGVYVAGMYGAPPTHGVLARCTKTGTCPP